MSRVLAKVVVNQCSRPPFSSNALLKQLHWLPLKVEWRKQFKLAALTFKAFHTGRPPYLIDCNISHSAHKVFTLIISSAIYSATQTIIWIS